MTVLIDTHVLLWALAEPDKLSERARQVIADRGTTVLVSAASAWEIATKHRLGKLDRAKIIVDHYSDHLRTLSVREVTINSTHALLAGSFEVAHRDPFDRMIAAQGVLLDTVVMTSDNAFQLFPCRTMW